MNLPKHIPKGDVKNDICRSVKFMICTQRPNKTLMHNISATRKNLNELKSF